MEKQKAANNSIAGTEPLKKFMSQRNVSIFRNFQNPLRQVNRSVRNKKNEMEN